MTTAPRVEVYTQLACNAIHGRPIDYNHTTSIPDVLSPSNFTFILSAPDDETEPDDPMHLPSKRCLADPQVQAGAARLQTIMTTTMGTLSALTTGWWGHFGERHGRLRVLIASSLGLFLTDLTFLLVSTPGSLLASHGHKFLVVGPFVEGLLGGWSTLQSATSA